MQTGLGSRQIGSLLPASTLRQAAQALTARGTQGTSPGHASPPGTRMEDGLPGPSLSAITLKGLAQKHHLFS